MEKFPDLRFEILQRTKNPYKIYTMINWPMTHYVDPRIEPSGVPHMIRYPRMPIIFLRVKDPPRFLLILIKKSLSIHKTIFELILPQHCILPG